MAWAVTVYGTPPTVWSLPDLLYTTKVLINYSSKTIIFRTNVAILCVCTNVKLQEQN